MTHIGVGPWGEVSGSLVFRSKLRPPWAERLIDRPRLLETLDTASSTPLTLVISPAGTGKTSLVSSWVTRTNRPTAWLSVDDTDRDGAQFWSGVVAAVETLVPGGLARAMASFQGPGDPLRAVATLLDDLEAHDLPPSSLILDDIHLVDGNPEIVNSLAVFLQHLPVWLHVVLLARRTPRLPVARLRSRGQLAELSFADLAFSADEATELLGILGPVLDAERIQSIVARADGWAADLRLAALTATSTTTRPDESDARENVLVTEYLWKELLTAESAALVDVLLDVSVVERAGAGLAQCLTGRDDAGALLALAQARGLFVSRIGSTDWFEIHSLVRERLRSELGDRSPGRAGELHARAAGWFETAGEVAVALGHWIQAERPDQALRLLAAKASSLWDAGRVETISSTLARIPSELARDDAEIAIELAWCWLFLDRAVFLQLVAEATASADRLPKVNQVVRGRLTMLHSIAATLQGDWTRGAQLARRGMVRLGKRQSTDLLGRFGWNMVARDIALSERWDEGDETRIAQYELSGDPERRLVFEGTRALGHALAGHPVDALRVVAGIRQAASVASLSALRLELAVAEAIAHREDGERERAAAELETLTTAPLGPVSYAGVLAHLELTQLYLDDDNRAQAAVSYRRAADLVDSDFDGPGGRGQLARVGTLLALANGDFERARSLAGTIADSFWAPVSLARVDLATDNRRAALDQLEQAVPRCVRHEVTKGLLLARALPRHEDAVEVAGVAAERAAACSLVQTVASEGPEPVALIEPSAWRVSESWLDRLRRAPTGIRTTSLPVPGTVERLTEREWAVLRLLPGRLTLSEIADELFISRNTLKFHLKVIYRKLGCSSRAEAATTVHQLTWTRPAQPSAILRR